MIRRIIKQELAIASLDSPNRKTLTIIEFNSNCSALTVRVHVVEILNRI